VHLIEERELPLNGAGKIDRVLARNMLSGLFGDSHEPRAR
jgi:hypothetical protein